MAPSPYWDSVQERFWYDPHLRSGQDEARKRQT